MELYSLPYFFLVLFYILLHFYEIKVVSPKIKGKIRSVCAFIFLLFFGFRGLIGTDWFNYREYYDEATMSIWNARDYEIGFSFIAKLMHDLKFSYASFVLLITAGQVYLWNRFLKTESKYICLSYAVLISIFPLLIIDLLRNFTSILIAIQAIDLIKRGKKLMAVGVILLSITFHTTGVFFLTLTLLGKNYIRKSLVVWLFVIGVVIYFLQIKLLESVILFVGQQLGGRLEYLANSVVSSDESYGVRIGILEKIFVILLVLNRYKYIVKNRLMEPLYINVLILYCFIFLYFSSIDALVNRFSLLFFWAYVVVLANFREIHNNKKITYLVIMLCLIKTYVTFNNELYDYTNWIFIEDSPFSREMIRNKHYFFR